MRILILADCYFPSTKAGAKLVHDLAVEFHRLGHETAVVTSDNDIPGAARTGIEEGVTVVRVKTGWIKGAPKVIRAINEARLSAVIWKRARTFLTSQRFDLIIYYSPSIFFGPLIRRLKRLYGCSSYLILRDIFPQWAVDAGALGKRSLPYWFFRRKELQQYATADIIGVQSPGNLRYFQEQGFDGRYRLEVLYNWTAITGEKVPRTDFRRQLNLQGKVVFFYGGNIGVAQDMDNFVRLAASLREATDLFFLLVGDGSEANRLQGLIRQLGLPNIAIHPPVDQETYLGLLSECDVGLISLEKRLTTQNFPGKMLAYMYLSIPILASVNPGNDLKDTLTEHQAGFVCLNGDDDELRECALRLGRDPELRRNLGTNARTLLEKRFSVSSAASQILSHVAF